MRVLIKSDGTSDGTFVQNGDTGEMLPFVTKVAFEIASTMPNQVPRSKCVIEMLAVPAEFTFDDPEYTMNFKATVQDFENMIEGIDPGCCYRNQLVAWQEHREDFYSSTATINDHALLYRELCKLKYNDPRVLASEAAACIGLQINNNRS